MSTNEGEVPIPTPPPAPEGSRGRFSWVIDLIKVLALPLVTLIMLQLAGLFSGAVVTERLYSWPGVGTLFINSVDDIDYPVLMGILTIAATLIVVCNLLADVLYAYLDPRIKYS